MTRSSSGWTPLGSRCNHHTRTPLKFWNETSLSSNSTSKADPSECFIEAEDLRRASGRIERAPAKYQIRPVTPIDGITRSVICPIHKKGNKLTSEIHRGISLLCMLCTTFTKILEKRIRLYADKTIDEYREGFWTARSTFEQLFWVKQLEIQCVRPSNICELQGGIRKY